MAYWPTRTGFTLPEQAIADIELFMGMLSDVPKAIESAKRLRPAFQVSQLLDTIAREVDHSPSDLRRIFNTLENLLELKSEFGSAEAAVDGLAHAVTPELKEKIEPKRSELSHILGLYDANNPVSITFKAQRLTYLRERLFHEAELITDARPVFDDTGENILQFVITHSLVLTSWADNSFQRQHISVDNADILKLRDACDRAILKSRALKQALDPKWTTEILKDAPNE